MLRKEPWSVVWRILIVYAIARITNEFFREPDATLLLGMTRGQFYSLFLILAGGIVIFWAKQSAKTQTMKISRIGCSPFFFKNIAIGNYLSLTPCNIS